MLTLSVSTRPIQAPAVVPFRDFDDAAPIPLDLAPIAAYLASRNYTDFAIRAVVAHVRQYGTAEMCCYLDFDRDRAEVERLIPGNAYHWPAWTDSVACTIAADA